MNLFTRDSEGREVVVHKDEEVFDTSLRRTDVFSPVDALLADIHGRQNGVRWYVVRTNWTTTVTANTWYSIIPNTETIKGDIVDSFGRFRCQVSGRYVLTALFEGRLSVPLVDIIKTQRIQVEYIVTHADGTSSGSVRFGRNSAQRAYIPAGGPTAIIEWSIPRADVIDLLEGDTITFQWKHISAGDIGFFDEYYFDFALVRVADPLKSSTCCNCQ